MTSPPPAADTASATDPGPPPSAPAGMPTRSERFFSWVRGFGVVRIDGWLGGVCAGIAARLRIDPAIVRGIVVVAAVLGVPMFFLYALAWALLPDLRGRIHLQEVFRGRWSSAMTGILILALVNLLPLLPWLWSLALWPLGGFASSSGYPGGGLQYAWEMLPSGLTLVLGWTLVLVVIGGLIYLGVRGARGRRSPRADSDPRRASADVAAPGTAEAPSSGDGASAALTVPLGPPAMTDAAEASGSADGTAAGPAPEPQRPSGPATDSDIAAWREQHEAWRTQNDAWRRAQQDAGRAARDEARRERAAAGAVFAAEAEERRRVRRLTAPRTSFAVVAFVLGAALVTGAATALWSSVDTEFSVALGLLAATLVVGLSMIVAGALRRRTGFLAFVAILLLVSSSVATVAPTFRTVHVGDYSLTSYSQIESPFVQLWGSVQLHLLDLRKSREPIVIDQGDGHVSITMTPGVELELSALSGSGAVNVIRHDRSTDEYADRAFDHDRTLVDGRYLIEATLTSEGAPVTTRQRVEIDQRSGSITVFVTEP